MSGDLITGGVSEGLEGAGGNIHNEVWCVRVSNISDVLWHQVSEPAVHYICIYLEC